MNRSKGDGLRRISGLDAQKWKVRTRGPGAKREGNLAPRHVKLLSNLSTYFFDSRMDKHTDGVVDCAT